jgi:hypothetical protein
VLGLCRSEISKEEATGREPETGFMDTFSSLQGIHTKCLDSPGGTASLCSTNGSHAHPSHVVRSKE